MGFQSNQYKFPVYIPLHLTYKGTKLSKKNGGLWDLNIRVGNGLINKQYIYIYILTGTTLGFISQTSLFVYFF